MQSIFCVAPHCPRGSHGPYKSEENQFHPVLALLGTGTLNQMNQMRKCIIVALDEVRLKTTFSHYQFAQQWSICPKVTNPIISITKFGNTPSGSELLQNNSDPLPPPKKPFLFKSPLSATLQCQRPDCYAVISCARIIYVRNRREQQPSLFFLLRQEAGRPGIGGSR